MLLFAHVLHSNHFFLIIAFSPFPCFFFLFSRIVSYFLGKPKQPALPRKWGSSKGRQGMVEHVDAVDHDSQREAVP